MRNEQSKIRVIKAKNTHQPLIPNKKVLEIKDKENQKYNYEHNTKSRINHHHDFTNTLQHEYKSNNYISIPYQPHLHHNKNNKDRYGQTQPHQNHGGYYVQNTKTLTFANAKHGGKKQGSVLTEQSSFVSLVNEHKKIQPHKNNTLIDKDKYSNLTQRTQKPQPQKQLQKKDSLNANKANIQNKANFQMGFDDFKCKQELQFKPSQIKPVQKKSIVPEKKFTAQKTTSKFDFTNKVKPNDKVQKVQKFDVIKQFQKKEKAINNQTYSESLNFICDLQQEYSVNSNYIKNNHKKLTMWTRAVLVDWMRHISYQFALQRNTYHTAVVLLDNYLSRTVNVPKSILQAIGATCLFIASKLQEFQCRPSQDFVQSTNNSCSKEDIHQLQIKIVMTMKFKINPPTLFSLANVMMQQWDMFLNEQGKDHPLCKNNAIVHFKQLDQNSYMMFRKLMQLIDCSVIDIETVQYPPKMLVSSFMYLLIGQNMNIFDKQQILQQFPLSSLYLIDPGCQYNNFFNLYVQNVFGFGLRDMLPTVQYCATYFQLCFSFEKPMLDDESNLEVMLLEQYCSYQTYNNSMSKTVKKRKRDIC